MRRSRIYHAIRRLDAGPGGGSRTPSIFVALLLVAGKRLIAQLLAGVTLFGVAVGRVGVGARSTFVAAPFVTARLPRSSEVTVVVSPSGRRGSPRLLLRNEGGDGPYRISDSLLPPASIPASPPPAEPPPTHRDVRRDLALIFVVAFGIRLLWAVITPPWQAPDETAHFTYIQHLVEQREIPRRQNTPYPLASVEEVTSRDLTLFRGLTGAGTSQGGTLPYLPITYDYYAARAYQSSGTNRWSQAGGSATPYPPLYYFFGAIPYAVFRDAPILTRLFAIRCVTAILGALSCVFAYLLAYELRRTRRWGWALGLAMALMPMYAFITATVNNDVAMNLCATALIWLIVRAVPREDLSRPLALAVGLTSGMALLTKPAILPVVAIAGIVVYGKLLAGLRLSWNQAREAALNFGTYAISLLALYMPWLLFRARHYGDIGFAAVPVRVLTRFLTETPVAASSAHLSVGLPPFAVSDFSLWDYLSYEKGLGWRYFHDLFFRTFWGDFGWLDAPLADRFYLPLIAVYALAGVGLLSQIFRQPTRRPILLVLLGIVAAQTIFLFIGVDWFEGFVVRGKGLGLQGRYFFPVLAPLLFLLLSGWDYLWGSRPAGLRIALAGMLALQLIALATMLTRYYGVVIG